MVKTKRDVLDLAASRSAVVPNISNLYKWLRSKELQFGCFTHIVNNDLR